MQTVTVSHLCPTTSLYAPDLVPRFADLSTKFSHHKSKCKIIIIMNVIINSSSHFTLSNNHHAVDKS